MKLATSSVTLSVDALTFEVGGVAVAATTKYPLLAIVNSNCSNGQLTASVDTHFGENLHVQLEESSNNPDQFFVLPNSTGAVHPEGEYAITFTCRNQTLVDTATIVVSILSAEESTQPYFTDTPRYVNVSSNTLPGTVIANYTATFSQQSTTQQYAVHTGFLGTPFQLDSSSGELSVRDSLQKEGTLSMYDIVIVAGQGQKEAWTVTTIVIENDPTGSDPTGSGMNGQASKIILTIVALLSVWAGCILP